MRLKVADLLPGTNYAVQVRAVRDGVPSEWSERFLLLTEKNIVVPAAPATTTWTDSGDAFIGTWTPVTQDTAGGTAIIDSYEVELVGNSVTKIISVSPLVGVNGTYTLSFSDNVNFFGTPAATVTFRVRAVNNKGIKGNWSGLLSDTNPAPGTPGNPTSGSVATAGVEQIMLAWSPPADTDLVGYNVYVGATAGFTPSSSNRIFTGAATRFTYTTGTTTAQFFKIYALDKFGQESATPLTGSASATSPAGTDTTPPANATAFAAAAGFDATRQDAYFDLSWTGSGATDKANYNIGVSTDNSTWSYIKVPADQTATRINNLVPNTSYYFKIQTEDWSANKSAFLNATSFPTTSSQDSTAPSQPAAPSVAVGVQRIQVNIPGTKQAGGAMEPDVSFYEVYASSTTGFTPAAANMLGTVPKGPAMIGDWHVPTATGTSTETWYVKIRAVDRTGNASLFSNQASGNVGLIINANIADATITNAKITDLSVAKLTSGTISAQTITIGATGSIIVDSTGVIKSNNYVANTSGYQLTNTGLEINGGSISAAALRLQVGRNIMPPMYADFEGHPSTYTGKFTTDSGGIISNVNTVNGKFGPQKWGGIWGSQGVPVRVYMGTSATDYNIPVEAGKTYIFSVYVWSGFVENATLKIKWSNGTVVTVDSQNTVGVDNAANAIRLSGAVQAPAGVTGVLVGWECSTTGVAGGVSLDGWQVEEKTGALSTPSTWTPPSFTAIDGGQIRTGTIRSSTDTTINGVTQPTWSINTSGAASFTSMQIRGNTVVGAASAEASLSFVQSFNYVKGSAGWIIRSDGSAEFRSIDTGSINPGSIGPGALIAEMALTTSGMITLNTDNGYEFTYGNNEGFLYTFNDQTKFRLPIDGTTPEYEGKITSADATMSGWTLKGADNVIQVGTTVTMESGLKPPPTPTIVGSFDSFQTWWAPGDGKGQLNGFAWDTTDSKYLMIDNFFGPTLVRTNGDGTFSNTYDLKSLELDATGYIKQESWGYGVTRIGNYYYFLIENPSGPSRYVLRKTVAGVVAGTLVNAELVVDVSGSLWRALTKDDSNNFYIMGRVGGGGAFLYRKYTNSGTDTFTAGANVTTDTAVIGGNYNSITVGSGDYGAERVVIGAMGPANAQHYVFTGPSGTAQLSNTQFPAASNKFVATTWRSGVGYQSITTDGKIYTYTGMYAASAVQTLVARAAYVYASSFGPYTEVSTTDDSASSSTKLVVRRSKITVNTAGSIPAPTMTNPPNATKFYIAVNGSGVWGANTPAAGQTSQSFTTAPVVTGGTLPTGSTFTGATAPKYVDSSANNVMSLDTNGALALGNTAAVPVYLPPGTWQQGQRNCASLTDNATNGPFAVTFATAFPASGPVPTVMITPNATGPNAYVSVGGVTRTGFNIYVRRLSGASMNVDWVAYAIA